MQRAFRETETVRHPPLKRGRNLVSCVDYPLLLALIPGLTPCKILPEHVNELSQNFIVAILLNPCEGAEVKTWISESCEVEPQEGDLIQVLTVL